MTTAPSAIDPNVAIFTYFVDQRNGQSYDWQSARQRAGEQAARMIAEAAQNGGSINDLLMVLYSAYSITGESGRRWVKYMIDFVKQWKPDFEQIPNRFPASQEEIKVDYDITLQSCVAYLEHLTSGAQSNLVGQLSVDDIFTADKLTKLRDLYKNPATASALDKLKSGDKLTNEDRGKLRALFDLAKETLSQLNQSFSGFSDRGDGVVSIDETALSSQATNLSTRQQRLLDQVVEMIRSGFNPGNFLR